MSSPAYEKAACLALGEAAYTILHNMLVATHPNADGAVWEWKEAEKVQRKRSEAFPDRRSTREGSAHCFPFSFTITSFLFSPLVHPTLQPPSQLRGGGGGGCGHRGNECFGYSLAQKPRRKCKQSADGMPPSKFPYLVLLAAAAER